MEERLFVPAGAIMNSPGPSNFLMSQKHMFADIQINIYLPVDPSVVNEAFRLADFIDDHFD